MNVVSGITFHGDNREEALPNFSLDFPYTASRAELDRYIEPFVPWHWHGAVELFTIESGRLEYETPRETRVFEAGMGGMVNANVLHTTRFQPSGGRNVQLIHLFDPGFLAGAPGSRVERKYILPITANYALELLPLSPDVPEERALLLDIRAAFDLGEDAWGYELRLREALSTIWLKLLALVAQSADEGGGIAPDAQLKTMMIYIHERCREQIAVSDVAASAHISPRACYRLFQERLHMTPLHYIASCRLQAARRLLVTTDDSVAAIAYACGFGSSSGFGKVFRAEFGCAPVEYRKRWRDRSDERQN